MYQFLHDDTVVVLQSVTKGDFVQSENVKSKSLVYTPQCYNLKFCAIVCCKGKVAIRLAEGFMK